MILNLKYYVARRGFLFETFVGSGACDLKLKVLDVEMVLLKQSKLNGSTAESFSKKALLLAETTFKRKKGLTQMMN